MEPLVVHTGVEEVSLAASDSVRRILDLREDHRKRIVDNLGRTAANGLTVLERLYETPIVSVGQIPDLIDTSYPVANNLVARLCDVGILFEVTGQARNRRFSYQPYIDMFVT